MKALILSLFLIGCASQVSDPPTKSDLAPGQQTDVSGVETPAQECIDQKLTVNGHSVFVNDCRKMELTPWMDIPDPPYKNENYGSKFENVQKLEGERASQ